MQVGHRHSKAAWLALALALCGAEAQPARADDRERVASLTHSLSSSSDKTRLAAVLGLAKLGSPPVQPPLTTALRDPSPRVRAVAATALGRLGCLSALPALRALATDDADPSVRQAASTAAIKLAQLPPPRDPADKSSDKLGADRPGDKLGDKIDRADGAAARRGVAPRGHDEVHASMYLVISSSADDSPGTTDKPTRKTHGEILRRVLAEQLRAEASVTSAAADAKRWGLDARHIDVAVTKLDTVRTGGYVEVRAELRLAISDDKGKLSSFLTGGAKVQVPDAKFDLQYLPALRRDVLESAVRGMFGKLMVHLRTNPA